MDLLALSGISNIQERTRPSLVLILFFLKWRLKSSASASLHVFSHLDKRRHLLQCGEMACGTQESGSAWRKPYADTLPWETTGRCSFHYHFYPYTFLSLSLLPIHFYPTPLLSTSAPTMHFRILHVNSEKGGVVVVKDLSSHSPF